ncbi:hypothetical protein Plhal703r1_c12g0062351 [Plasmopara halstedii]
MNYIVQNTSTRSVNMAFLVTPKHSDTACSPSLCPKLDGVAMMRAFHWL